MAGLIVEQGNLPDPVFIPPFDVHDGGNEKIHPVRGHPSLLRKVDVPFQKVALGLDLVQPDVVAVPPFERDVSVRYLDAVRVGALGGWVAKGDVMIHAVSMCGVCGWLVGHKMAGTLI